MTIYIPDAPWDCHICRLSGPPGTTPGRFSATMADPWSVWAFLNQESLPGHARTILDRGVLAELPHTYLVWLPDTPSLGWSWHMNHSLPLFQAVLDPTRGPSVGTASFDGLVHWNDAASPWRKTCPAPAACPAREVLRPEGSGTEVEEAKSIALEGMIHPL